MKSQSKSRYIPVSYQRICKYCGKEFEAHNKRTMYCSSKCKDASYKKHFDPRHVICVVCGTEFDTFHPSKKTCSLECSKTNKNRDKRAHLTLEEYKQFRKEQAKQRAETKAIEESWYKAFHTVKRECVECGAFFYCLDSEPNITCSAKCSKKHANRKPDKRVPVEQRVDNISLKKLYRRDKGICYLCGCVCDWDDWKISKKGNRYQGDKYPTIEHVVPISKGGLDSWNNVRLACWKCNFEKADGIIKIQPMSQKFAYSQKYSATQAKKTAQYTLDGNFIKIWDSTAQIKRELGLNDKRIQNVCRESKTGNAYGYHWEYIS